MGARDKIIPIAPIKTWSHSRLVDFEECPLKAKLKHVDRIPDPKPRTAADRGTAIHLEAELFVKGEAGFTSNLQRFKPEFDALRNLYQEGKVSLEGEWGFDHQWSVSEYFGKSTWGRIKADSVAYMSVEHAAVIDFKTGKKFGNEIKHAEQTQLYALGTFIRNPKIQTVTAELWYLDIDDLSTMTITRTQALKKYLPYFDKRARRMTSATKFEANPNIYSCKWCPYGPKGTGHCTVGVQP